MVLSELPLIWDPDSSTSPPSGICCEKGLWEGKGQGPIQHESVKSDENEGDVVRSVDTFVYGDDSSGMLRQQRVFLEDAEGEDQDEDRGRKQSRRQWRQRRILLAYVDLNSMSLKTKDRKDGNIDSSKVVTKTLSHVSSNISRWVASSG